MKKTHSAFLWLVLAASIALVLLTLSGCGHNPFEPPTVFSRAQSVRLDIKQGHFSKAEKKIAHMLAQTRIGRWRFAPFATFVGYVSAPSDQKFAEQLDAWVRQKPTSPLARLVRANYHYNKGWWFRGNGFSYEVEPSHFDRFQHELALASKDVEVAIQWAPGNPYAWGLQQLLARDTQSQEVRDATFKKAIAKFPGYYPLYSLRLGSLQPKWGGTPDAMKAFVKRYAGAAPDGSPLKMMNLSLYAELLSDASLNCDGIPQGDRQDACVARAMAATADANVTQDAYTAIRTFATRKDLGGVWEVEGALRSMARTPGGGAYAIQFLQAAAAALHSDPSLVSDKAGKNHYVIDQTAAYIWFQQGNDANALDLDRRALEDLANADFPNHGVASDARAGIERDMLTTYARQGNYQQAAAHGKEMATLSGGFGAASGYDRLTCEALYRLQQYPSALTVCSAAIEVSEDLQAYYFRARVYDALKQGKQAMADYRTVANSAAATEFRVYSVIAVAIIHGKDKKPLAALNSMDSFSDLFVEGRVSHSDLAVYFNNRCYFNMKLGRLRPALDDCETSLRYGHILDAVSKQQKLLRQLKERPVAHPVSSATMAGKGLH